MSKAIGKYLVEDKHYDDLNRTLPYIIAGLEGNTDGNEIVSITVQQAGLSTFRVVLRAIQRSDADDPVRVVGFTTATTAAGAFALVEKGYGGNDIKWKIDRYANGTKPNSDSKNKQLRITSH